MDEKWKQELSSQFAGAGSRLAETDPEWVEIAARFSRQEVPEASQLTQREQLLCILSALLGCQGTTDAASRFEKGLAKQVEQCLPYVGYPRSLNAMGIIDEVAQNMENR